MVNYIKSKLSTFNYVLSFLNSPMKLPKFLFYFGKIKMGTPYFLPRILVKNKDSKYMSFRNRKFGFDFVPLGWKFKYDEVRHEWDPMMSFVCFNKQFVIQITSNPIEIDTHYWETWLNYQYKTKGTKSERIQQLINNYPEIWITHENGNSVKVNYHFNVLKKKYHKYITINDER